MKLRYCLILLFLLLVQWACHSGEAQQSRTQPAAQAGKPADAAPERLLSIHLLLSEKPYSQPQQRQRFVQQVIGRIKALPEVNSIAVGSASPDSYDLRGTQREAFVDGGLYPYNAVTPEYFRVVKLELVSGRFFDEQDSMRNGRFMIISESVASEVFKGEDPLGTRIHLYEGSRKGPLLTVVGVVSDAQDETGKARKDVYGLYYQDPVSSCSTECIYIIVRTKSQSETVTEKLKEQIMAIDDKEATISDVKILPHK